MPKGGRDLENGKLLEGRYANYFEIGHNAFEFLLDFGQEYGESPAGRMHTRIVTSPVFAWRLAEVLNQAIQQYERRHGRIATETDAPERTGPKDNVRPILAVDKTP